MTSPPIRPSAHGHAGRRSEWVHPGTDRKLAYRHTAAGDRIIDFSHAGYMGGGVALPEVPVRRIVRPSGGGNDAAAIQSAIDQISALPPEGGFRGALLLAPGTFTCPHTITIGASGVVLRGSGSGQDRAGPSTLRLTEEPHPAVAIRATRAPADGASQPRGSRHGAVSTTVADAYLPSGATELTVADPRGFSIGDVIAIRRPVTAEWIRFMKMDDLTRDGHDLVWLPVGSAITTERRITAIAGRTMTLDVPVCDSFDASHLTPPGTIIRKVAPPARVSQSGIEQLHIVSPRQEFNHGRPHFTAIRIDGENCWARDVAIGETMNSVAVKGRCITVLRVTVSRAAQHQGSSRPAEFAPNGSQVLLDRCAVNADNVWFAATSARRVGPTVMLNCSFSGNGSVEPHQRWSTGLLCDNCRAPEGRFALRDRGLVGTGHGWSMGWGVLWNCEAAAYIVQNPPGVMNWMIGCIGTRILASGRHQAGEIIPEGTVDAHGQHVSPSSLYLAQLAERLGPAALRNIGYAPSTLDDGRDEDVTWGR